MLPVQVLIVDDHKIVRDWVRKSLTEAQAGIEVIGEAANGEEGVRLEVELNPHVVLMDMLMPGMAGWEATRQIRLHKPETEVIALGTPLLLEDDSKLAPMFKAGAIALMPKDMGALEYCVRVLQASQGEWSMFEDAYESWKEFLDHNAPDCRATKALRKVSTPPGYDQIYHKDRYRFSEWQMYLELELKRRFGR
jgi:DNA-binding NarL/FixJ family response regulator